MTPSLTDIDSPLAGCFMNDILVVVVSQSSRQLLIVHLWFVLPQTPAPGHLVKIVMKTVEYDVTPQKSTFFYKTWYLVYFNPYKTSSVKVDFLVASLTSSGSVSLNSQPSPVQDMNC